LPTDFFYPLSMFAGHFYRDGLCPPGSFFQQLFRCLIHISADPPETQWWSQITFSQDHDKFFRDSRNFLSKGQNTVRRVV